MTQIGANRLTAVDVYHYLDWLREAFADGDRLIEVEERDRETGRMRLRVVFQIDRQLDRLERVLAHVGEPYHDQAMDHVAALRRARLQANPDLEGTFALLRTVISEWDRSRRLRLVHTEESA